MTASSPPVQGQPSTQITLGYLTLDVFTDGEAGGNRLAVFPEATALSVIQMQEIARSLNFSETIFLEATSNAFEWDARIYTPAIELPFAGHPTVGAAVALAELGLTQVGGRVVLNEKVGPLEVSIGSIGRLKSATFSVPNPPRQMAIDLPVTERLAALLSVSSDELGPFAPAAYSAGVPFTLIAVANERALANVSLDLVAWRELLADSPAPHVVAYTMADWTVGSAVTLRMFAPAMGIEEDPATGAAAAALAGLLGDRQQRTGQRRRWLMRQGAQIGCPSQIHVEAEFVDGATDTVRIGGTAVLLGRETIELS